MKAIRAIQTGGAIRRAPALGIGAVALGLVLAPALVLSLAATPSVRAQSSFTGGAMAAPGAPPNLGGGLLSPAPEVSTSPAPLLLPPAVAPAQPSLMVPAGKVALELGARFGKNAPPITNGLTWRIYNAKPKPNGTFTLVKDDKEAAPSLLLPPGAYIVHVGFGLANAVRPISLRSETVHEVFDLPAGGLRLEGRVGDVKIPSSQINFDIYSGSQFEPGNHRPIAEKVTTGEVVIVPEGTYNIVSNYGNANSVVRSDIRVQAGKLTDITVTHRAAVITLKLVKDKGGEALANTSWSVLTPGGDVIKEAIGAFSRVVLAEGDYRAIAKYDGRVFEREFKVINGVDGDIEVLAR
jgi:hypothetical protein